MIGPLDYKQNLTLDIIIFILMKIMVYALLALWDNLQQLNQHLANEPRPDD